MAIPIISDIIGAFDREKDVSKTTSIDPAVQAFRDQLFGLASSQYNRPFQKFTGTRFAPFTEDMNQYMEGVRGLGASPGYGTVASSYQNLMNRGAPQTEQRSFLNANIQDYMNPYNAQVRDATINQYRDALANNLNQVGANAMQFTGGGAGYNDAEALERGVARAQTNKGMFDSLARLNQQGYDRATGLAMQDMAGMRATDQFNALRQQAQDSLGLQATSGLQNVTNAQRQERLQNLALQKQLGQMTQGFDQAQRDFDYQQFTEERDLPYKNLSMLAQILGASPTSQTTTGTQYANDFGTVAGLSALIPLIASSDRNNKTDISDGSQKVRSLLDTMKPFDYKYKDQDGLSGKRIGPMAQNLEKSEIGRMMVRDTPKGKIVDYGQGFNFLAGALGDIHQRLKSVGA